MKSKQLLSSFCLKDFKTVQNSKTIKFTPLTVFIGNKESYNADKIDARDHTAYIIARILDYSDMNDVKALRKIYSDKKIIEVIRTRRGLLSQTGKYWADNLKSPWMRSHV